MFYNFGNRFSRGIALVIFALVFSISSNLQAIAAPPSAPRIETAYSDSSTQVIIVFYGKIATVGDLPVTYTATSNPDSKTGSVTDLGEDGRGVLSVAGLKPSTTYTFIVSAKNKDGITNSEISTPVTTLSAGLTPTFSQTVATSSGFTTQISNFNKSFTYAIKSNKGNANIAPYDGSIVVENIGAPGELATITVTVSRTGYDTVSSTLSARSKSSNEPSRLAAKSPPRIIRTADTIECFAGDFEFLRNGKYPEKANVESVTYLLEVNSTNVSIFSSDEFKTSPRFIFPDFLSKISGVGNASSVKWNIANLEKKSPVKCVIYAYQEGASLNTSTISLAESAVPSGRVARKSINCKKGEQIRRVSGANPKCPRGYVLVS